MLPTRYTVARTVPDPDWLRHVAGYLREFTANPPTVDRASLENRMEEVSPGDYYAVFSFIGLEYGPSFRGIKRLWRGEAEALGQIELSKEYRADAAHYRFHPTLLDPCTQVILGTIREAIGEDNLYYLPVYIDRLRFFTPPKDRLVWSYVRCTKFNRYGLEVDIRIFDDDGNVLTEIDGYQCRALERQSARETPMSWLFETRWYEKPLTRDMAPPMPSMKEIIDASKRELAALDHELGWSRMRDRAEPALNGLAAAYVWQALRGARGNLPRG